MSCQVLVREAERERERERESSVAEKILIGLIIPEFDNQLRAGPINRH